MIPQLQERLKFLARVVARESRGVLTLVHVAERMIAEIRRRGWLS